MSALKRKCPIALIISRSLWVHTEICWKASSHAFWSRLETKIQWQRTEFEMLFSLPILFTVARCWCELVFGSCFDVGHRKLCIVFLHCQPGVYWITRRAPGLCRAQAADPWPCQLSDVANVARPSRPHMISHPAHPATQVSAVTTQWASQRQESSGQPVTISDQSNCGENLLMRQICTILVFARGNIFLISLNKEIVPCATVHQSQIIVIISIKIRLHHGFMFSRFSQIS